MRTDVNNLTFGIEIETAIPGEAFNANGWTVGPYHVGAPIPNFDGWKTMSDASIATRWPNVAVEVVSPILKGAAGLESVRAMVAQLNTMGAKVNSSTGFHVHVGWNGTPEQLRRLVCFMAHHERAFYASTGTTSREGNIYCNSIKVNMRAFETQTIEQERAARVAGRYHVLNLTNLGPMGKRTVEFRVFAGTLNVTKIQAYIQLCLGAVLKALDNPRKALPFEAPLPVRAGVPVTTTKVGMTAMRHLLTHLHWRETTKVGRVSTGVIDPTLTAAMTRELYRMARKYDARREGRATR